METTRLRRFALYAAGGVAIVILVPTLWRFLRTGTLHISTNEPTTITKIYSEDGAQLTTETTENNRTFSLSSGRYTVSVSGKVKSLTKTVDIKGRNSTVIKLDDTTAELHEPEPVTAEFASGLHVSNGVLGFLDNTSQQVVQISPQNTYSSLSTHQFERISWLNNTYAIGFGTEGVNYLIEYAQKIVTPLSELNQKNVSYTVAADGNVYVYKNGGLFSMNLPSGSLRPVFNTPLQAAPRVIPGVGRFAIFTSKTKVGEQSPQLTTALGVYDSTGKKINEVSFNDTEGVESRFNAAWSPDGMWLAVTDTEGLGHIYDKNLKKVASIPTEDVFNPIWIDNTTLAYDGMNSVWLYTLAEKQAVTLSSFLPDQRIQEMTYDKDSRKLYLSVSTGENTSIVYRVDVERQKVDPSLYMLSTALPVTLADECYVGYTNFTRLNLTLFVDTAVNGPSCEKRARDYLADSEIDISGIPAQIIPLY